jgi:hypothetical protein
MKDFDFLCNENKNLRKKEMHLEEVNLENERRIAELEADAEQWENLKEEKWAILQERLKMQSEEKMGLKEVEMQLRAELEIQCEELDRVRAVLNNYEWKLFCLETELDLCNK